MLAKNMTYRGFKLEMVRARGAGGGIFYWATRASDGWELVTGLENFDTFDDIISTLKGDVDLFLSEDYDGRYDYPPDDPKHHEGIGGGGVVRPTSKVDREDTQNDVRELSSRHLSNSNAEGDKVRYYHIIRKRKRRMLGMTIAAEARETSEGMHVTCGIAYCAPIEDNFSRPLGRKISEHRMRFDNAKSRMVPYYKHFKFTTPDLNGLKVKILRELLGFLPINWARGLINSEVDLLTKAWRERQGVVVKKAGEHPKRLVAKKVRKRRSKVDAHPKKQEIIVRLNRGDSARSVAWWTTLEHNGPVISESTISRFRNSLPG